jgi:phage/plasmid primase-like uncharacterized protein
MRRRAILALALLAPVAAFAQDNAVLNEAASDAALAFMKALRKNDIETAMQFAGAPFVAEDSELLATEGDVKAYLTAMCAQVEAAEMPNAVLAILDYDQSRAATAEQALKLRDAVLGKGDLLVATGRDGISRGVLLVKANGGKPVVVGVGY